MFITIITFLYYSSIKPSVFIGEGVRQIVHKIPRFTVNKKGKKIFQYSRHYHIKNGTVVLCVFVD